MPIFLELKLAKVGTSFQYSTFKRRRKQRKLHSVVCRNCSLPTKPLTSSARNLTRFETEVSKHTEVNKLEFAFKRGQDFCNIETCDNPTGVEKSRKNYAEIHRLAAQDLGEDYTVGQYTRWMKGKF